MPADSLTRAIWAAGIWAATSYGLTALAGGRTDAGTTLYDAAIMGGSSWTSDLIHDWTNMAPTTMSSALVCGALFAAAEKGLRDDNNYLANFGAAALNEFATDWVGNMGAAQTLQDDAVVSDGA